MVTVLHIARVELLRLLRDRSNLFFVFIFPLLLVVLIGAAFGSSANARVGVVAPADDPRAADYVRALDEAEGLEPVDVDDAGQLRDDVASGLLGAGVVVPDGYGEALRTASAVEVRYVGRPDATSATIRSVVEAVASEHAAVGDAAAAAAGILGTDVAPLVEVAESVRGHVPGVEVATTEAGGDELAREFAGLGQFDLGASSQLFLFTFLLALAGGGALIQTRELGVARRMLASPTPVGVILAGEAAGRIAVALLQAGYIIVATVLLFRVDWGDPLATALVVLLFAVAAGGAGMLVGATLRNDSQASAAGVGLGLGLAALGGSMMPLELFPPGMAAVARLTPHAWANLAMAEIVRRDGGVTDVLTELGVLAGFAVVLLGVATWRLQQVLTR